jgi:hypothetical protein
VLGFENAGTPSIVPLKSDKMRSSQSMPVPGARTAD